VDDVSRRVKIQSNMIERNMVELQFGMFVARTYHVKKPATMYTVLPSSCTRNTKEESIHVLAPLFTTHSQCPFHHSWIFDASAKFNDPSKPALLAGNCR
jgi:hypothetical protein